MRGKTKGAICNLILLSFYFFPPVGGFWVVVRSPPTSHDLLHCGGFWVMLVGFGFGCFLFFAKWFGCGGRWSSWRMVDCCGHQWVASHWAIVGVVVLIIKLSFFVWVMDWIFFFKCKRKQVQNKFLLERIFIVLYSIYLYFIVEINWV